ncbi:MAG: hypothetical protein ACT4P1_11355 [Sporichthyaceae bacterium]
MPAAICGAEGTVRGDADGYSRGIPHREYGTVELWVDANEALNGLVVADLTHDGVEDAAMLLSCGTGGGLAVSRIETRVVVFDGTAPESALGLVPLPAAPADSGATFADALEVRDGELFVTSGVYAPSDATCCPSRAVLSRWGWTGSYFSEFSSTPGTFAGVELPDTAGRRAPRDAQLALIAGELGSGDQMRSDLVMSEGAQLEDTFGTRRIGIEFHKQSFRSLGDRWGIIDADLGSDGGAPQRWSLYLDDREAPWQVAAAAPASAVDALSQLTLAPGVLGPLRVGMSAEQAVGTGLVGRSFLPEESSCGEIYQARDLPGVLADFRSDDPDDLDSLLIREPWVATDRGVRVGSSLSELRAAYGADLRTAANNYGEVFFVEGAAGRLVFGADNTDVVALIQVAPVGALPEGGC